MEILQQIFELCVIPLLGVLTTYLVKLIRKKNKELDEKVSNNISRKYIDMLADTITNCVVSTNQTYVDALKEANAFDKEAQKKAFELTYNKIMNVLTEDAKEYLEVKKIDKDKEKENNIIYYNFKKAVGDFPVEKKIDKQVNLLFYNGYTAKEISSYVGLTERQINYIVKKSKIYKRRLVPWIIMKIFMKLIQKMLL